ASVQLEGVRVLVAHPEFRRAPAAVAQRERDRVDRVEAQPVVVAPGQIEAAEAAGQPPVERQQRRAGQPIQGRHRLQPRRPGGRRDQRRRDQQEQEPAQRERQLKTLATNYTNFTKWIYYYLGTSICPSRRAMTASGSRPSISASGLSSRR